jgi:two-component system response regulator FixJ
MPDAPGSLVAVVDDDEAVRDSLCMLLGAFGFDVVAFPSAAALLACPTLDRMGCALIDHHMPDMSGTDLVARLCNHAPHLPVALMTALPTPEMARHAEQLGAAVMLEKPLAMEPMLAFLRRALGGA